MTDSKRPKFDPRKSYVFFDMDGVVADYDGYAQSAGLSLDDAAGVQGTFLWLKPVSGAIETIALMMEQGLFEPYFASKPCTDSPASYTEKVLWVERYAPFMRKRIVLTQNKGLLGSSKDFLIDDRPHKANCGQFPGLLIAFPYGDFSFWNQLRGIFCDTGAGNPGDAATVARTRLFKITDIDWAESSKASVPA